MNNPFKDRTVGEVAKSFDSQLNIVRLYLSTKANIHLVKNGEDSDLAPIIAAQISNYLVGDDLDAKPNKEVPKETVVIIKEIKPKVVDYATDFMKSDKGIRELVVYTLRMMFALIGIADMRLDDHGIWSKPEIVRIREILNVWANEFPDSISDKKYRWIIAKTIGSYEKIKGAPELHLGEVQKGLGDGIISFIQNKVNKKIYTISTVPEGNSKNWQIKVLEGYGNKNLFKAMGLGELICDFYDTFALSNNGEYVDYVPFSEGQLAWLQQSDKEKIKNLYQKQAIWFFRGAPLDSWLYFPEVFNKTHQRQVYTIKEWNSFNKVKKKLF